MFENYSYKQKFRALIIIFIMLSIAAYKRSFHPLIQSYSEYQILASKIEDFNKNFGNMQSLSKEVTLLDKTIGKSNLSKEVIQQEIIKFISTRNKTVSLDNILPIHTFKDDNYTIITNQIEVSGNTNHLLKLAYDFEKEFSISKILSMKLYTSKKNDKEEVLHLKIIFQNYENNK